jgi:hypothetical protein
MKNRIILCWGLLLFGTTLTNAQACRERNITDSLECSLLREYIRDAHQKVFDYCFDLDQKTGMLMGIILLREYWDKDGHRHWELDCTLNNGYTNALPREYDIFDNDVILIYKAGEMGQELEVNTDSALRACIDSVVTDRVYQYPKATYRWSESKNRVTKQLEKEKDTFYGVRNGRGKNLWHVVFYDSIKMYKILHKDGQR